MTVIIKYVERETIAFMIDEELFYLRQGPGIPQIFNGSLKLQTIPNINNWFQTKTQRRYSHRDICDMASAFTTGLQHSYTTDDFVKIGKEIVVATVKTIFQTDNSREFSRAYWIELMDPGKLQKLIEIIRSDFDRFKAKYNPEELYNILCRLWQFSNFYAPSEAAVFETLIRIQLKRSPQIPQYPNTSNIDSDIQKIVLGNLLSKTHNKFKDISNELINNVRNIQIRGL